MAGDSFADAARKYAGKITLGPKSTIQDRIRPQRRGKLTSTDEPKEAPPGGSSGVVQTTEKRNK